MRKVVLPPSSAAGNPIGAGSARAYRTRGVRLAARHLNFSAKRLSFREASQAASSPRHTVREHTAGLKKSVPATFLQQSARPTLLQDERVLAALVVVPLLAGISALAIGSGPNANTGKNSESREVLHDVRQAVPLLKAGREKLPLVRTGHDPAEEAPQSAPRSTVAYTLHEQTWLAPADRLCRVRAEHVDDATRAAPMAAGGADFGERLAAAAELQLNDLVVYDERYRLLKYPMGDVEQIFGVCTDVVVRAYRSVGVDLQQLVKKSGVSRGDTNIDHRRTVILRKFFARYGKALPISDIADDFAPGDIVTYVRPQNFGSNWHIAIVSRVRAPSGRLMIIHNRGWGPQLEDALFVDRITGHYRFNGSMETAKLSGPQPDRQRMREKRRGISNRGQRLGKEEARKLRVRIRMRETSAVVGRPQNPGS